MYSPSFDVARLMVFSPAYATPICFAIFFGRVWLARADWRQLLPKFLTNVCAGVGFFLTVAFAYVIAMTAYYQSGNGPLALIFYGPAAVSIGATIGALVWLVKPSSSIASENGH